MQKGSGGNACPTDVAGVPVDLRSDQNPVALPSVALGFWDIFIHWGDNPNFNNSILQVDWLNS